MGEEIRNIGFDAEDFRRFAERLAVETRMARELFENRRFSNRGLELGFEIEAWIVDHNYSPAAVNEALLQAVDNPQVGPELSRFNVELNPSPLPLEADAFSRAERILCALWTRCNDVAHGLDANMVMIGTLPTIRDADMTLENISKLNRYYALNNEVLRRRRGRPLRVDIKGADHLVSEHRDVMLEAAATSFQIHLKIPADRAHLYYNASIAASAPIIAASGNAPFLFGKSLWHETRIPLFEQAVDIPEKTRRVSMGSGYAARSCIELFEENLADYPVLLPIFFEESPAALRHLRLHNGTIWRWNRALVGFDEDGTPHLRIEHRILPAGPSIPDMVANTALYCGLVHDLTRSGEATALAFEQALSNFYAAARLGLDAELVWPGASFSEARELLLRHILPCARRGLEDLGVAGGSYLDTVEERVEGGQTGAVWQRRGLALREGDAFRLMAAYCERQRSGAPVHQWEP
jgi:gamma-glutamyl:cysteine ligase YbdK (ATP-grasp superfamily)